MPAAPTIVWFRQDLRLDDQPALVRAVERGGPVIALHLFAPEDEGPWAPGGASRWWLHRSLASLSASLAERGCPLVIRTGRAVEAIPKLVDETGADAVVAGRRFEPAAIEVERELREALKRKRVSLDLVETQLLLVTESIRTGGGSPYKVYTPFSRACRKAMPSGKPLGVPNLPKLDRAPKGESIAKLGLLPKDRGEPDWDAAFPARWQPGETGARARLDRFLAGPVGRYGTDRDLPDLDGTSSLSPHLHFGEISIRRIWHATGLAISRKTDETFVTEVEKFRSELLWREFAHHVLVHFPRTDLEPLRPEFAKFPWRKDAKALDAWRRGRTGYPLVDAGMRQLWQTGWMHNRVRMVVASFLVKHLLLPWQEGARWFWDTLVDADLANNSLGWQWSAGCGADAAPYFRIFNPVSQGEKFDPDARYIRRWVPELAKVPAKLVHAPWLASPAALAPAGVTLGKTYPRPIVEHGMARERALSALSTIAKGKVPAGAGGDA
jgi:deoxyribodipyrimidine photo-lyase